MRDTTLKGAVSGIWKTEKSMRCEKCNDYTFQNPPLLSKTVSHSPSLQAVIHIHEGNHSNHSEAAGGGDTGLCNILVATLTPKVTLLTLFRIKHYFDHH